MGRGRGYGQSAVCVCVCGLRVWLLGSDSVCWAYWLRVTKGIVHSVSVNVCVCLFLVFAPEGYRAHLQYSELHTHTHR